MRTVYSILLIVSAGIQEYGGGSIARAEKGEDFIAIKIRQLVDAALDPPPRSGDITIIRNQVYRNRTLDEGSMRKTIEDAIRSLPKDTTYDETQIRQDIEANLARVKHAYSRPRQSKERIRWQSLKYRLDQTVAEDGAAVDNTAEFDRTFCNNGNIAANDFSNFRYDMPTKNASRDDRPGSHFTPVDVDGLYRMDQIIRAVVVSAVAETRPVKEPVPDIVLVPVPARIQSVIDGTHPELKITIDQRRWRDRDVDHVTLSSSGKKGGKATGRIEAWLDPNDFRKVYHWECFAQDGRKLVDLTKDGIDTDGLARSMEREIVSKDGSVLKEEIAVIDGTFGCPVPAEAFAFNPPEGFFVVDFRGDEPVIESAPMPVGSRPLAVERRNSWLMAVTIAVMTLLALLVATKRLRTLPSHH